MKLKITIEKTIDFSKDNIWIDAEDLGDLSTKELIELFYEDINEFLDGASWEITRSVL